MKTRALCLALVALLLAACQTTTRSGGSRSGASYTPRAFFWEAKAPDGGQLFLLGSVHIGDGRELALDPKIESDWRSAQELVVELDVTALSPIDAIEAMNRHGLLPEPRTLREVVRAETFKLVTEYMKQRQYPMDRIEQMRPWMVALVVQELEYGAVGLQAENGVDAVLLRRAKGVKPIVALESLDEQMAIFAGLPDALQESWLTDVLRESAALLGYTREMLRVWESGDDAAMSALFFPEEAADPLQSQFYESMYWSRNRAMTERLAVLAADGKPRFVVVGTGHLLGPTGIPELLAQRGFAVQRLGSARVVGGASAAPAAAVAPEAAPPPAATPAPPPVAPALTTPVVAPVAPVAPAPEPVSEPVPPPPSPPLVQPAPAAAPAPPLRGDIHDQWLAQDVDAATAPAVEPPPPAAQPAPATRKQPAAPPKRKPAATQRKR